MCECSVSCATAEMLLYRAHRVTSVTVAVAKVSHVKGMMGDAM